MRDASIRRGDLWILRDVHWRLPQGRSAAVLGPNGSGKTTLMRMLTGYMWPTQGGVEVLGRRLGRTDVRELRRHVAVVDPGRRFAVDERLTARQAVLTGYFGTLYLYDPTTEHQRARADELLKSVGLAHRRDYPLRVLSTGEKRRCLLGRALVNVPRMLILDEPTAGLDMAGRERLLASIEQLRRSHPELTVVSVTHHVEEISPATDQVLLMREGRVLATGAPDHIITPESLTQCFGCRVFVQKRSGRFWLEVLPEAWVDLLEQSG